MNPVSGIVKGNLLCEHDRGSFRCAVRWRSIEWNKALDTGSVDNPASGFFGSVDILQRLLSQHVLSGILTAKKDALCIDGHRLVIVFFRSLVNPQRLDVRAFNRYPSIVGNDVQSPKLTYTSLNCCLNVAGYCQIRFDEYCSFASLL